MIFRNWYSSLKRKFSGNYSLENLYKGDENFEKGDKEKKGILEQIIAPLRQAAGFD